MENPAGLFFCDHLLGAEQGMMCVVAFTEFLGGD